MTLPIDYQPNSNIHSASSQKLTKKSKYILLILFLSLITAPFIPLAIVKKKAASATKNNAILSPLAENQTEDSQKAAKKVYSLEYYLSLSQSFMQKATRLANDDPYQTSEEKLIIINQLNEALQAANRAIEFYPQSPKAYLTRAEIYQKILPLYPEAAQAAQADLDFAQKLIAQNGSNNIQNSDKQSSDKSDNPIEYIPTQKASLAQNITIATGKETNIDPSQTKMDTNAEAGQAVLPAGLDKIKVYVGALNSDDMVYVVPTNNQDNITLSVSAKKTDSWFEISADHAPETDLPCQWWIISQHHEAEQSENSNQINSVSNYKTVS